MISFSHAVIILAGRNWQVEQASMATKFEPELLTAEEYGRLPDDGRLTDLVRGRIVEMNWPFTSHGYYVARISQLLTRFVEQHGIERHRPSDVARCVTGV